MPDTKIKKEAQGWIDTDEPTTFYRVRRLARAARRAKKTQSAGAAVQRIKDTITRTAVKRAAVVSIIDSDSDSDSGDQLTSLQERLLQRLTKTQGVAEDDALEIIKSNGYNKAASYGHMRAAGSTHAEAKIVIALSEPAVSLAYGTGRGRGLSHTDALREALQDGNNNVSSTNPY